jgi:hypothetical protein
LRVLEFIPDSELRGEKLLKKQKVRKTGDHHHHHDDDDDALESRRAESVSE